MSGKFDCTKNALVGLNVCYILVSFVLIGVATYGKTANYVESLPIIGGIAACGIFLLVISIVGLIGAVRHHQVMLFFYMIILFLIFIIQFSVACACLAVGPEQELQLAYKGWNASTDDTKFQAETTFECCGFKTQNVSEAVRCREIAACNSTNSEGSDYSCPTCEEQIKESINSAFNAAGGVGLFFSFTEIIGALLACRYRNLVDPRAAIVPPGNSDTPFGSL